MNQGLRGFIKLDEIVNIIALKQLELHGIRTNFWSLNNCCASAKIKMSSVSCNDRGQYKRG